MLEYGLNLDRILGFKDNTPSDHKMVCNGRVALSIFPLVDSTGSEANV